MKPIHCIKAFLFAALGVCLIGCNPESFSIDSENVYFISNDSSNVHLEYTPPEFLDYKYETHHSSCTKTLDRDEVLISNISDSSLVEAETGEFGKMQPFLRHTCDSSFFHEYVIISKNLHFIRDVSEPVVYKEEAVKKFLLTNKGAEEISNIEVVKLNNDYNLIIWKSYSEMLCINSLQGVIGNNKHLFSIVYSQMNFFDEEKMKKVRSSFIDVKII